VRHALAPTRRTIEDFPFAVELRVRFVETDAMGIVHHAAYLAYLESARVEYLRAAGRPYDVIRREDGLDFPVIGLQLAYHAPLRFDELFRVHTGVAHVRRGSFAMEYLVERDGRAVLDGFTLHAAVDSMSGRPVRLPAFLAEHDGRSDPPATAYH
jgi:acyl-CoA thioester hydrolase